METITCRRCGLEGQPPLERPPFKSDLGERIKAEICADCWKKWLVHQTRLINHYGLVPHQPQARATLLKNLEEFCFGQGAPDRIP